MPSSQCKVSRRRRKLEELTRLLSRSNLIIEQDGWSYRSNKLQDSQKRAIGQCTCTSEPEIHVLARPSPDSMHLRGQSRDSLNHKGNLLFICFQRPNPEYMSRRVVDDLLTLKTFIKSDQLLRKNINRESLGYPFKIVWSFR